ncbi:hypothetical protein I4U23_010503 [Adineta vaga]|nr:hypothetical protein I4U23_010503 [Adineta vaga]
MVVISYPNRNRYEGEVKNEKKHGQGTLYYANGGKYKGNWENDLRHGYGINTWQNGDRYEGNWTNNRRSGQGTFYYANGEIRSCEWRNGREVSDEQGQETSHVVDKRKSTRYKYDPLHCPRMILPREFVKSLKWPETLFDTGEDRCYCSRCYPLDWKDVIEAGGGKYVVPRGWIRFGLRVDPVFCETHDIWNKGIVTFHGTTKIAALSIVKHRHFCLPGDALIDGTVLGIREGHIPDQKYIFTSPTIVYSSSRVYSPIYSFQSKENNQTYQAQLVLQCRQMPNTYNIQRETIGLGRKRICPYISNDKMEYFTDRRATLLAYGLLVRIGEHLV